MTTANHKIRVELDLSCQEFIFMECIAEFTKKKKYNLSTKDIYNKILFEEGEIETCFRVLFKKGLLKAEGTQIKATEEWTKYFTKKKGFVPPEVEEVKDYFKENGYSLKAAEKAFKYYNTAEWRDSMDKPIKNWKQKMIGVWFKDENLAPKGPEKVEGCPYNAKQIYQAKHYLSNDGVTPEWFDDKYLHLIQ